MDSYDNNMTSGSSTRRNDDMSFGGSSNSGFYNTRDSSYGNSGLGGSSTGNMRRSDEYESGSGGMSGMGASAGSMGRDSMESSGTTGSSGSFGSDERRGGNLGSSGSSGYGNKSGMYSDFSA